MILFDTSVLIEVLRKNNKILTKIEEFQSEPLFTTEICVLELLFGIHGNKHYVNNTKLKSRRIKEMTIILNNFRVLPFGRQAALRTAEILGNLKLEGKMIDFRDGMIAGITLANGISKIYTLNKRDFQRIEGVELT